MESKDAKPIQKPSGWGARHTLTVLGFVAFALSYAMRFNLAMAIVAMVRTSPHASTGDNQLAGGGQECPRPTEVHLRSGRVFELNITTEILTSSNDTGILPDDDDGWTSAGEFDWDEEEQGLILGCFFFGYIVTQLPGGILGQRLGGKWPMGIGLLITAVFTLLTPTAAYLGKEALITVRIIQGLGEGVTMPSMHALLSKWAPVQERSMLSAAVYAGMSLGTAATMLISGYLIHYFGWPAVFYASGGCTIIWFVLWSLLVVNIPADHPRISAEELEYISASLSSSGVDEKQKLPPVPWKLVLTSGPFWAIMFCQTLETWGLYTLLHEIPTYMQNVLHFDMKQNCIFSAVPHLVAWIVAIGVTQIGDRLIEKKVLSVGTVRKSCNTIGLWGAALALVGTAYSGCSQLAAPSLLTVAVGCYGALLGGIVINLIDIAPNYASILMGIVNTFATLSGFGAPWLAGFILKGNPSLERWKIVFLVAAAVCFVANLLFVLLASGEEQDWNEGGKKPNDTHDVSLHWVGGNLWNSGEGKNLSNVELKGITHHVDAPASHHADQCGTYTVKNL